MSKMATLSRPEHWRADSAGDSVVVLDIPASLSRVRDFDIDVTLVVKVPVDGIQSWHELNLEVDGRKQPVHVCRCDGGGCGAWCACNSASLGERVICSAREEPAVIRTKAPVLSCAF